MINKQSFHSDCAWTMCFNLNCPIFGFKKKVCPGIAAVMEILFGEKNTHKNSIYQIGFQHQINTYIFTHMTSATVCCCCLYYMQLNSCDCIFFFKSMFFFVKNKVFIRKSKQVNWGIFFSVCCSTSGLWYFVDYYYLEFLLLIIHEWKLTRKLMKINLTWKSFCFAL